MNPQRTQLRAAAALRGGQAGRRHVAFRDHLAAELHRVAPGAVRVHLTPIYTDPSGVPTRRTLVSLATLTGQPIEADADAHRAARRLVLDAFPAADWTRPHIYRADTGRLVDTTPTAPADLDVAQEVNR
ncbi:hypothetical protein SEA_AUSTINTATIOUS_32 [Streptomyces phage Austintatious]|uniref:Uncharacterized protein n=1 Tax=Streptomyces phage Austintatious TaxID=2500795 RepID=A0A411AXG8_9CAUD|nr:hypothetical protein HOV10_gp32 [Streptomyces phage Austintatious]QAX92793.1 hypothetical protein SEA_AUSTINTATIOUS_32 [Streptomyces phage Austintatious]